MAAFDVRHISAPLSSKLNLVTMIFVVTLFTVYRLSMGNVDSQPIPQKKSALQAQPAPQVPVVQVPIEKPVEKKIEEVPVSSKPEDFLKELLEKPTTSQAPAVVVPADEEAPLDDVEKALGIAR